MTIAVIVLNYYLSGSLVAQARDSLQNGALLQVAPSGSLGSGSIAGCVLYGEGFILLTGSWNLSNTFVEPYIPSSAPDYPKWVYFGNTGSTGISENLPGSSFELMFEGTSIIPTLTLLCHAGKGEFNVSSNPTFTEYGYGNRATTSSYSYVEKDNVPIKNINPVLWDSDPTGSFEKITYITSVGIYDREKNLIGIAKLAKPIRKKETDNFMFKLRIDL